MRRLSDRVLKSLRESKDRTYKGIFYVYRICHAEQADVDFIERKSRFFDGMYSYYRIDGVKGL